jgi:hypothetical protein
MMPMMISINGKLQTVQDAPLFKTNYIKDFIASGGMIRDIIYRYKGLEGKLNKDSTRELHIMKDLYELILYYLLVKYDVYITIYEDKNALESIGHILDRSFVDIEIRNKGKKISISYKEFNSNLTSETFYNYCGQDMSRIFLSKMEKIQKAFIEKYFTYLTERNEILSDFSLPLKNKIDNVLINDDEMLKLFLKSEEPYDENEKIYNFKDFMEEFMELCIDQSLSLD